MSGRSVVLHMSLGIWSYLPKSASILHSTPGNRSVGAGLLLAVSAASPSLRNWVHCWLPNWLPWLACCVLLSTTFASVLSTCSCRHLNLPWDGMILHPHRMCWRDVLRALQRLQTCYVPNRCLRFQGEGRVGCPRSMRKLIWACAL